MNIHNEEIRPPPGFEHLFPVVKIPTSKESYLVKIDEYEISDAEFSLEMAEELPISTDPSKLKSINLMGESDYEESSDEIEFGEYCAESDEDNDQKGQKSDRVNWGEDINQRKIFVGNVPFNCTQEGFEECFDDISGIYKADIVKGHRDDSRGIGFVTMNTIEDAETLKKREDIKCKGRTLRFYPYQNNASNNTTESINQIGRAHV